MMMSETKLMIIREEDEDEEAETSFSEEKGKEIVVEEGDDGTSLRPYLLEKWKKYQLVTELNWRGQRLQSLPREMEVSFKNLCVLNLAYNHFESWPEVVCQLKFLECLFMNGNKLTRISKDIRNLSHLRWFFLAENQLVELPETLGDLVSLERLSLGSVYGGNQLTCLPESIGHLRSLKELDLSHNRLRELPQTVGSLQGLVTLSCFDNQLERLPLSLSECKHLRSMDLGRNCLIEIPSSFGSTLKELEYMNLVENRLEHLPYEITNRRDITLLISGNPFLETAFLVSTSNLRDTEIQMTRIPSLVELSARMMIQQQQTGTDLVSREDVLPYPLKLYLTCGRLCSKCRGPMFRDCLRNVAVSEYLGHPSVPQKRYLCSPKCLVKCQQKFIQKMDW